MKTLEKLTDKHWIDPTHISGVMKIEKGYRILLGPNGVMVDKLFTRKEVLAMAYRFGFAVAGL